MKVVASTVLLREAAEVLAPIREDVVVIGALAVQIALDGHEVNLSPTRDVDAGVKTEDVERVVSHLEAQGLAPSDMEHERRFTWVKGDLKVQLLRPFHPFPRGAARGLPENNIVGELGLYRHLVAFDTDPEVGRFFAASPAALVGLKEAAFGRTRPSGEPVDRDFSDVALLLDRIGEAIATEVATLSPMRGRVLRAAERLAGDEAALVAAARELVGSGQEESQRSAEDFVRRAAVRFVRHLDASAPDDPRARPG